MQNKKEILPFIIYSPFVQFSSIFSSVVWLSSDLFYKDICQTQELDKIKLKNKTQMKFKTSQNNNIETINNIFQEKKKKEANLLKNSPSSKNKENKKEESFFLECSLCFFNPKIGDRLVVTKNISSKNLKMGSIGIIEKISFSNKIIVKFYKKPIFTKNWTLDQLNNSHPLFLPEKKSFY